MIAAGREAHEIKMAQFGSGSAEPSPRSDKECSPNTSFASNSTVGEASFTVKINFYFFSFFLNSDIQRLILFLFFNFFLTEFFNYLKLFSSGCSIDLSSLRSTLSCAICSLPLLDAVVVPCSHGVRTFAATFFPLSFSFAFFL